MEPCTCECCKLLGYDLLLRLSDYNYSLTDRLQKFYKNKKLLKYLIEGLKKDDISTTKYKLLKHEIMKIKYQTGDTKLIIRKIINSLDDCKFFQEFIVSNNTEPEVIKFLTWRKKNAAIIDKLLSLNEEVLNSIKTQAVLDAELCYRYAEKYLKLREKRLRRRAFIHKKVLAGWIFARRTDGVARRTSGGALHSTCQKTQTL